MKAESDSAGVVKEGNCIFFFWPLSDYHRNSILPPLFLPVHCSLKMIRPLKKIPIANENGIANGRHVPLDRALSLRFSSIWGYVGHSSATCEAIMILRERGEDKGGDLFIVRLLLLRRFTRGTQRKLLKFNGIVSFIGSTSEALYHWRIWNEMFKLLLQIWWWLIFRKFFSRTWDKN